MKPKNAHSVQHAVIIFQSIKVEYQTSIYQQLKPPPSRPHTSTKCLSAGSYKEDKNIIFILRRVNLLFFKELIPLDVNFWTSRVIEYCLITDPTDLLLLPCVSRSIQGTLPHTVTSENIQTPSLYCVVDLIL